MRIRTDDDIYRARLVYLGPPGYTLPVQLPYAEIGLFVVLAVVLIGASVLLTGSWALDGVALAAAIFLTSYIWGHVDQDKPARKVLLVAVLDWRAIKPKREKLPRLTATHIRFRSQITGTEITNRGNGDV